MSGNAIDSARAAHSPREQPPSVAVSPEVDDILPAVFDLNTPDLRMYRALLDRPSATTQELADVIGVDRSTANRSLKRLHERGLLYRQRRVLQEGGHCYVYTAMDVEEAQELLQDGLAVWAERARDELDGLLVPER